MQFATATAAQFSIKNRFSRAQIQQVKKERSIKYRDFHRSTFLMMDSLQRTKFTQVLAQMKGSLASSILLRRCTQQASTGH